MIASLCISVIQDYRRIGDLENHGNCGTACAGRLPPHRRFRNNYTAMSYSSRFIHLHVHSEYSLIDGLIGIKALIQTLVKHETPAIALTDHCNVFAMVKFYRAAQAAGIKPIIGANVWVGNTITDKKPFQLVLLCQNKIGYKNLCCLMSKAYLEGQQTRVPMIQKSWFDTYNEGLIVLSNGREGEIGQAILANQRVLAEKLTTQWSQLFVNRFYIELQRTGREYEAFYNQVALEIASAQDIPIVASNDVRFLTRDDFEAHEARVCIHEGFLLDDHRRTKRYSAEQYLRTEAEMVALFADVPEALANTVEIAKRCNLSLEFNKNFLPNFPVPEGINLEIFFTQACHQGLQKRFLLIPKANKILYQERLAHEISIIQKMGFTGYFLIVADFIDWSKKHHIPVGPGRGSGAGSLVAYALGITDIDPIQHDLLFERFLNPERISMPDFDIDFCMEGRDKVIDYVAQKYGRDKVAQIITYGTMAARAVVRDVGRVLGYPYGFFDKIAKLIPFELGMTLEKAIQNEPQLLARYENEAEVKTLIDLARQLEGVPRNAGTHAGGVVIAPSELTDFIPLYCELGGENRVIQLDKNDVEKIGLIKFDFLGLRTLTIMDHAIGTINAHRQAVAKPVLDLMQLPLDDKKPFDLLKSCDTTAVFQLESRGIKEVIRRLQPERFDEITALVALYRPGPLQSGMVNNFIDRKHGRAEVVYPHPLLEPILRTTYGVILYQEQVMQIAQVLAGYTLGSADILRSAMGKKKPEEMAKQRLIFVNGAMQKHAIDNKIAHQIFDLMQMFGDYGFNKSHSVAYALVSYQTAWLKTHYPAEFMAAVLSSDMDHTDKLVHFLEDTKKRGLVILPPDINQGEYQFTVSKQGDIIYGLGAIKGVGQMAIENILAQRKNQGIFLDLFTFCQSIDTRKVNRRVIEALIRSGALDSFQIERSILMASVPLALKFAEQHNRIKGIGQFDLFNMQVLANTVSVTPYVEKAPWSETERLNHEKAVLGWYVSGHPITKYNKELACFVSSIDTLDLAREKIVTIAGYIIALRLGFSKNGSRMAFLVLDDNTGRIEVGVFKEVYENYHALLIKDQLVIVSGNIVADNYTQQSKLYAREIYNLDQGREKYAQFIVIKVCQAQVTDKFLAELKTILLQFSGGSCAVRIHYFHPLASIFLQLTNNWQVKISEELIAALQLLTGFDIGIQYKKS